MTIYTNVNKPVLPDYSNVNSSGKEQYDQVSLSYDDSSTYYDGVNPNMYSNVSKPVLPTYTNIAKPN